MSENKSLPLMVNGWTIFAHPMFLTQLEVLIRQVEALKQKDSIGYKKKNAGKRLAAIVKLAFEVIPQDPARPEYRQGQYSRRRPQALVPSQVLSAVPAVLSLSHSSQGNHVHLGQ
jgi:hypothetical protein